MDAPLSELDLDTGDDRLDSALDLDGELDFETAFEEALAPVPDSDEPSGPRHNAFLRVAYGRKLLNFEQEQQLGRHLNDARQAMTEGLSHFAISIAMLIEAWDAAVVGSRSPGDVLQWPSGNGPANDDADPQGARQRMAMLSLRYGCWQGELDGAEPLEAPMDLRKMFIDAAPAFSMLCRLEEAASAAIDASPPRSKRKLQALRETLEGVKAAQLRFADARKVMLESNLRLVFSIAGKFVNNGIAYDDLVQEGTIGLMRAIEKFQPKLGFKFSTYASNWIWQAVTRAIANQRRTVRVPAHVHDKMIRVRGIAARIETETGRTPGVNELASASDLAPEVVARALNAANRSLSLDAPVRGGEDTTFLELTPDARSSSNEDDLHQERLVHAVGELIEELPQREATILHLRLGLDGNDALTLEEIGARLGITRERTRQLQNRALDHLRRRLKEKCIAMG